MLVLGCSVGMSLVYDNYVPTFPPHWFHDAAAVVAEDGRVIAGVEEGEAEPD